MKKIGIILITLSLVACGGSGGGGENIKKPSIKTSKNKVAKTRGEVKDTKGEKVQITNKKAVTVVEEKKLTTTLEPIKAPKVWKEFEAKNIEHNKHFLLADGSGKEIVNGLDSRITSDFDNGHDSAIMKAVNGGTVINEGELVIQGKTNIGMWAKGTGSRAINKGVIVVNGERNAAMVATEGGTIINEGTIKLAEFRKTDNEDSSGNKAFILVGGKLVNKGKVIFGK